MSMDIINIILSIIALLVCHFYLTNSLLTNIRVLLNFLISLNSTAANISLSLFWPYSTSVSFLWIK